MIDLAPVFSGGKPALGAGKLDDFSERLRLLIFR